MLEKFLDGAAGVGLLMPESAGGIEDAGDLVRRIDIGDRPYIPAPREVSAWDLMPRIFGMHEVRKQNQVRQAPFSRTRRAGNRLQPGENGCRADMRVTPPGGKTREGTKMPFSLDQLGRAPRRPPGC